MKNTIFTLFILTFGLSTTAQYTTTETIVQDTFASGIIKNRLITKVKEYEKFDLHESYKKVTTIYTEYYESGQLSMDATRVWKHGNWGKPCGEIEYHEKQYYQNGTLKYKEERKCDAHRWEYFEYAENGDLLYRKKGWSSYGIEPTDSTATTGNTP